MRWESRSWEPSDRGSDSLAWSHPLVSRMADEHREVNVSGPHDPVEDPHGSLSRKKSQILTSTRAPHTMRISVGQ